MALIKYRSFILRYLSVMRPSVAFFPIRRFVEPYVSGVIGQLRPTTADIVYILPVVAVYPATVYQLFPFFGVPFRSSASGPG